MKTLIDIGIGILLFLLQCLQGSSGCHKNTSIVQSSENRPSTSLFFLSLKMSAIVEERFSHGLFSITYPIE